MTNLEHLEIKAALHNFLDSGKRIYKGSEVIEPQSKIPTKISYAALKNLNKLKEVETMRESITEKLKEEYKKSVSFDESKYSAEKEYAQKIDKELIDFVFGSDIYKEFMNDNTEIDYHVVKLSLEKTESPDVLCLEDIDSEGKFDLVSIPSLLLEHLILLQ